MADIENYEFTIALCEWFDEHNIQHSVIFDGVALNIQFVIHGQCFVTILHVFDDGTLEDLKARILRSIRRYTGHKAIDAALHKVLHDD